MAITLYDAFYSFLTRTGAIAQGLCACLPDVAIVQSGVDSIVQTGSCVHASLDYTMRKWSELFCKQKEEL